MKSAAPKAIRRRLAALGLAAIALPSATGCSFTNPQATTITYAPSDGIVEDIGQVELLNLLLVSKAPSSEGRYLGNIHNESDQDVEVVLTVEGTSTRLTVPAEGRLELAEPENQHVIPNTGAFPGALTNATVEVGGQIEHLQIPVLDGTLEHYREYVPDGWNQDTLDHLYTAPAAPDSGH